MSISRNRKGNVDSRINYLDKIEVHTTIVGEYHLSTIQVEEKEEAKFTLSSYAGVYST